MLINFVHYIFFSKLKMKELWSERIIFLKLNYNLNGNKMKNPVAELDANTLEKIKPS